MLGITTIGLVFLVALSCSNESLVLGACSAGNSDSSESTKHWTINFIFISSFKNTNTFKGGAVQVFDDSDEPIFVNSRPVGVGFGSQNYAAQISRELLSTMETFSLINSLDGVVSTWYIAGENTILQLPAGASNNTFYVVNAGSTQTYCQNYLSSEKSYCFSRSHACS